MILVRDGPWSYCNSYSYVTLRYGNYELENSVTGACNSEARTNVVWWFERVLELSCNVLDSSSTTLPTRLSTVF
jgi:hypothetical protein